MDKMSKPINLQNCTGPVLDTVKGFDVIECKTCGFKHILPVPTADELQKIYQSDYYTNEKPLYLEQHTEDLDWWNLVYNERFDFFEEKLPPSQRQILDIGSGPGYFLLHGKNRGWKTIGFEPSSSAAAHSRSLGINIIEDFFEERTVKDIGMFDVVHLENVFEHIPDPIGMLKLIRSVLKPGGILCVITPNDYNPFQQILVDSCGYDTWWLAPPHHINYFDFNSMNNLLTNNGFTILKSEATFPIDIFLLMGDNYIGNDKIGRSCHRKRMLFETNIAAANQTPMKKKLYNALAELGIGRELCIYAQLGV